MRAKARRGFLPAGVDGVKLEERLVLSQGAMAAPALVFNPARQSARALRRLSSQQRVNQAFDQFTADYFQAQQVYLQSTGLTNAQQTFQNYTTQRVDLLTQQLIVALSRLPGASAKLLPNQRLTPSMSTALQSFLYRKIDGNLPLTSNSSYGNISLLTTLNAAVPPAPTDGSAISPAAATLFTLKASSAIESARLSTINAAYLMRFGLYGRHN